MFKANQLLLWGEGLVHEFVEATPPPGSLPSLFYTFSPPPPLLGNARMGELKYIWVLRPHHLKPT